MPEPAEGLLGLVEVSLLLLHCGTVAKEFGNIQQKNGAVARNSQNKKEGRGKRARRADRRIVPITRENQNVLCIYCTYSTKPLESLISHNPMEQGE
jgi:hypothetical protein